MRAILAPWLVLAATACAAAGEVAPPDQLLPRGEEIPGWRLAEEPATFPADDLWRHIDGAAEQYLGFGCTALAVGYYRPGAPGEAGTEAGKAAAEAPEITVEVYQTKDPRGSFGLYALERSAAGPFLALGAEGYQAGGEVIFFGGPFYIKVRAYPEGETANAAALALARAIAAAQLAQSTFPDELKLFPREPLSPAEFGFVPQSVLGLSSMRDAFLARYHGGEDELALYFARPGGAAAAREMFAAMGRELTARGVHPPVEAAVAGAKGLRGELKYHGPVLLLLREGDLILATGALDTVWGRPVVEALVANLGVTGTDSR
jgi:hypothetical protein